MPALKNKIISICQKFKSNIGKMFWNVTPDISDKINVTLIFKDLTDKA